MPGGRMRRRFIATAVFITAASFGPQISGQSKQPPAPSEWGQFELLGVQPRGGLSPDGKWLVYAINRSNRNNELRSRNIGSGVEKTVAFGSAPSFSADSKWIAYSIGHSEAQEERLRTERRPIPKKSSSIWRNR